MSKPRFPRKRPRHLATTEIKIKGRTEPKYQVDARSAADSAGALLALKPFHPSLCPPCRTMS